MLRQISQKDHLQIIVSPGTTGTIKFLKADALTPVEALQLVCKTANLNCVLKENVWIVSPQKSLGAKNDAKRLRRIDAMELQEIDVKSALSMVADQFNVPIVVSPDVQGKMLYINLSDKTPRQAIALIAAAANLKVEESPDGKLTITSSVDIP